MAGTAQTASFFKLRGASLPSIFQGGETVSVKTSFLPNREEAHNTHSHLKRSSPMLSSRLLWRSSWNKHQIMNARLGHINDRQRERDAVVPPLHLSAIHPGQSCCLCCEPADQCLQWCAVSLLHPAPGSVTFSNTSVLRHLILLNKQVSWLNEALLHLSNIFVWPCGSVWSSSWSCCPASAAVWLWELLSQWAIWTPPTPAF